MNGYEALNSFMASALAVSTCPRKAVSFFSIVTSASCSFFFWLPSSSNFFLSSFTSLLRVRRASLYYSCSSVKVLLRLHRRAITLSWATLLSCNAFMQTNTYKQNNCQLLSSEWIKKKEKRKRRIRVRSKRPDAPSSSVICSAQGSTSLSLMIDSITSTT